MAGWPPLFLAIKSLAGAVTPSGEGTAVRSILSRPAPLSPPPLPAPPVLPQVPARIAPKPRAPPGQPLPHVAVRAALPAWRWIGASAWVLELIEAGLFLPWRAEPPQWRPPPIPLPPDVQHWAVVEVGRWCERGFARRASTAEARKVRWVPVSFVVDMNTRPRLVTDYKHQNAFLEDRPFKYEVMADFVINLCLNDHLTSWDVVDAFHDVYLAEREIFLLAFAVAGTVYLPLTMPFGLKLAPWVWTRMLRPVIAYLRVRGFKVLPYMDDFGYLSSGPRPVSAARATRGRAKEVKVLRSLGLVVHKRKRAVEGTRSLDLLGLRIATHRCLLLLPPHRLRSVVRSAVSLRRYVTTHARCVSLTSLQRFSGLAVSTAPAVPNARLHLQALYACFREDPRRGQRRLDARALADLVWLCSLATSPKVGRALWQIPVVRENSTDACGYGWWSVLNRLVPTRGFFSTAVLPAHINTKELWGAVLALRSLPKLRGPGVVRFRLDSLVNLHFINSTRSRSPALMAVVRELHWELHRRQLRAKAVWLSTVTNHHADRLSRELNSSDWRLRRSIFLVLAARWEPLHVDRFAPSTKAQLPRFNAAVACPCAEAVDAWWQDWPGVTSYVNPPFVQAALAATKVTTKGAAAVMVLPVWTAL